MSKKKIAFFTIIIAVVLDQIIKIYVKTHFKLDQSVKIFDWFRIHFVENNGMAMGIEFGGSTGKLFLTLFRLVAVVGIVYWLMNIINNNIEEGSIELEFTSRSNMFISYPAVIVRYIGKNWHTSAHSSQRIFSKSSGDGKELLRRVYSNN